MKIDRDSQRFLRQVLCDSDLSLSEYDLIHTVRYHPGISQEELRQMYHQDKSTIARRAARLEKMGYLERRVDPRDSRRKQLYATDLAEELKATKASVESFFYEWLVEDVPADELETFVSVLNRLNSKAKSERMEGFANLMARYAAQVGRTPTPKQRPR
jgi:DNA-binding MarR family transcriptional regulator